MSVFGDYAKYYDLLYRDKDYESETAFVLNVLSKHGCEPETLLDLGSGTGRHSVPFAARSIAVTGVDLSKMMVEMARNGRHQDVEESAAPPEFLVGDARTVRVGRKFDVVTALFHVMSYQKREKDALDVFATAREHLHQGGLFFFDFWYGPGVLNLRPEERDLYLEDETIHLHRHATPDLDLNENIVDVNYTIKLTPQNGTPSELKETHSMRYWFLPELRHLAGEEGFAVESHGRWLSDAQPDDSTWAAWIVARRL